MSARGFALLWSKILDSSLWVKESKETRLVWVTILAMRDSEGLVQSSVIGLADRAKVGVEECRQALEVLMAPDIDDTSGVEEGRRLRAVPGGWQIVNHELYRFSTEAKREFWRDQKRQQRDKEVKNGTYRLRKKNLGQAMKDARNSSPLPIRRSPPAEFVDEARPGDEI